MNHKINNIQALRAFAAFVVVLYHGNIRLPHMELFGTFGVDIFFVISGYIMARICETNPSFFFRRRLIRILPPYWLLTSLLFLVALRHPELLGSSRADGREYFESLFFIPFYKSTGLMRPLLFVGWSLNFEMFFYITITAGLMFFPRRPLVTASCLILLAIAVLGRFAGQGAFFKFYSDPVMYEFLFGFAAYEIASRVSPEAARRYRLLTLGVLIASLLELLHHHGIAPVHLAHREWAFTGVLSFFLVLSASLLSQADWDIQLGWIVLIGDASYILYLIHPYIESFFNRILLQRIHWQPIVGPAHLAAVLMTVPIAVLLHLWLEKPTVSLLNKRFGGKRKSTEMSGAHATPDEVAPHAKAS